MEPIEEECEGFFCELGEFVNRQQQVLVSETMSFRKAKSEIEAECTHLREQSERNREHLNEHISNKSILETTVASLEEQMTKLKLEAEIEKPKEVVSVEERAAQIKRQTKMAKEALEDKESSLKIKESVLKKGVQNFERVLGMSLTQDRESKTLSITFTKVDKRDPQRQFSFDLKETAKDVYQVMNVHPALSNNELDHLQNCNKDKSFIVQSVRRLFKESVSQEY